jgi:sugar lactone lactonase YvrE
MLIGIPLAAALGPPSRAAVVHEFSLQETGILALGQVWGVAADADGFIYATDTGAHRIVKFTPTGSPVKAWGTEGSGAGQLYFPTGVATGTSAVNGASRIYAVDNGNHRIVTFNENGKFLAAFGSEGSASNQFLNPTSIAALSFPKTGKTEPGTQELCVTDTRNDRVSCFTEQGQWLKSFTCADCPGGVFQSPEGIAVRRLEGGAIRYYVTDLYPGRIVVLNTFGKHVQTIGGPGQSFELEFPDDLAVDAEGNVYVTNTSFDNGRVMKFDPDGKLVFTFRDTPSGPLISPHGIAIDSAGDLIVANFFEVAVHKFAIKPPRIAVQYFLLDPDDSRAARKEGQELFLYTYYNGVERYNDAAVSCNTQFSIKINADGRPWLIRTALANMPVGHVHRRFKLPLSNAQLTRIIDAINDRIAVWIKTELTAKCTGDEPRVTATSRTRLN